jgi:hypothetical protein
LGGIYPFSGPYFLQKVIQFVDAKEEEPIWFGVLYALGILIGAFVVSLFINAYFLRVYRVGMNVSLHLSLYRYIVTLSLFSLSHTHIKMKIN